MSQATPEVLENFKAKAGLCGATVVEAASLSEVAQYVVDVCANKTPCEILADEPGVAVGPEKGPNGMPTRAQRIIAAPCVDEKVFAELKKLAEEKGFACLDGGLRKHLSGIDVGLSFAKCGVAASGTCLVAGTDEDARLAGMISEINVVVLNKSAIYPDLPSVCGILRDLQKDGQISYNTFISGPSRTADIERVPAVGVHGPLELHIILLED
ncbi:MAG: lactate utilization protein [Desulfovibrionaceae bacterium]|nr:lactate utilization protein [Desulfovibrionaceae bacterium]